MAKKKPTPKQEETANKRLVKPGASPVSGTEPPAAHRFKPGNPGGPGAPKKLKGLQDLILETFGEEVQITDADGRRAKIMRLQAMIRTMIIKSPSDRIALLEYVYGKVPQAHLFSKMTDEQLIQYILAGEAGSDSGSQESGANNSSGDRDETEATDGAAPSPGRDGGG